MQQEPSTARSTAAITKATRPFAKEDRATTWRLFVSTVFVVFASSACAVHATWLPLRLLGSTVMGLTMVRLFIFFHDHQHGAIFRDSRLGKACMTVVGLVMLNPPSVWKETHDYHHRNNAKMLGSAIGSYPTVTTKIYAKMKPSQRRMYAFIRHPLTMLFGYFTVFVAGMCLSSFVRAPKTHWQGPFALLLQAGILYGMTAMWGVSAMLLGFALPMAGSLAVGAYLFYAQHNFPDVKLADRRTWNYHDAAVHASSMFDMSPLMHWFTGNIGFHHVHHLNHNIPFYRLPEAMAAVPELQTPGRTSWSLRDVTACLRLKLWDTSQQRMVGWNGT